MISNKAYDILKWTAQILLPAVGTLYFSLADLWGLPKALEVVGTIAAVDAFLGVILGISTLQYNKSDARFDGVMEVSKQDTSLIHQFEINTEPEQLQDQDSVLFKVRKVDIEEH